MDSRFRGNDCALQRPSLANGTASAGSRARQASGKKKLGNLRFRSGEQGLAIRIDLNGDLGHFGNLLIADHYFQHEASMCGWILLVEDKIAEAVSHPAPAILLEWLNDMRTAADDKVGPG